MARRDQNICEECGSPYFRDGSEMASLCAECAHHLFGYPPCPHEFAEGHCISCGWNGRHSDYLAKRLKRHAMSDAEILTELEAHRTACLAHPQFTQLREAAPEGCALLCLSFQAVAPEYADSDVQYLCLLGGAQIVRGYLSASPEDTPPAPHVEDLSTWEARQPERDIRQLHIARKHTAKLNLAR